MKPDAGKTYVLSRDDNYGHGQSKGPVLCMVIQRGKEPYRMTHLVKHSPTGFEYGYMGSGPTDLARSMVADMLGEDAITIERTFGLRDRIIARLKGDGPHYLNEDALRAELNIP